MSITGAGDVTSPSNRSNPSNGSGGNSDLGKDDFLNLLITQLNNQDPMSPQDNGQFIAQLAQFSSLEGVQNLNDTVNGLGALMQSNQALQASSLVGRKVVVEGETVHVDTSKAYKGQVVLPESSDNVYVNVYDDKGSLVTRIDLGAQKSGQVDFEWDGKDENGGTLPPGNYKFTAHAKYEDQTKALYTLLPSTVESVTLNSGKVTLNLTGGNKVDLSKVQTISK